MTCFINVLPRDFELQPKLFWLQRVNSPLIIGVYHSSPWNFFTFSLNQVTEVVRPPRQHYQFVGSFNNRSKGRLCHFWVSDIPLKLITVSLLLYSSNKLSTSSFVHSDMLTPVRIAIQCHHCHCSPIQPVSHQLYEM